MIDGLVDWLGANGRSITQRGAIRLADAKELVGLLGTGDDLDHDVLGNQRALRTSRDLPTLTLVGAVAEECGAVELTRSKMRAAPAWRDRSVIERAEEMIDGLLAAGPLGHREAANALNEAVRELLDGGVVHWLVGVLPPGTEREIDDIVQLAMLVYDEHLAGVSGGVRELVIEHNVHELFGVLELAGLVELHDRETVTDRWGISSRHGGTFTGTTLLRHVLPPYAHEAGYDFTEIADLASAAADVVVDAYLGGDLDAAAIVSQWRTDEPLADRLADIADIAARSDESGVRVGVFALIDEYGDWPAAAPALRRLIDTPAAGHAALHLMEHGLATPEEASEFMSVGPLVDHLSLLVDEPEMMAALFAESQQRMVGDLIDAMWRHDQPETLPVLEALGRALPDKRLAKAARKAAIRHRSWLANLHR